MDQALLNLVLALAANEVVHNVMEASNVRNKVARLRAYIGKKSYTELPMKIDTRPKAYLLSVTSFVIVVGIFYGLFTVMNVTGNDALWYMVALLVVANFVSAYLLDKYHVEIEKVTRPFMKKK